MVRIICEKQSRTDWLARYDGDRSQTGFKGKTPLEAVCKLLENCDRGFRLEHFKPDSIELVLRKPDQNWFEIGGGREPSHYLYSALTIGLIAAGAAPVCASLMAIIWIHRIWSTGGWNPAGLS